MDSNVPTNAEAELESFRQKWREEVTARTQSKAPAKSSSKSSSSAAKPHVSKTSASSPAHQSHARQRSVEEVDEAAPYAYGNLGEKQHGRRLDETSAQTAAALAANSEPTSALEHYEKAVERETQGKLGDSVNLYRKAFRVSTIFGVPHYIRTNIGKLDSRVHETYKAKHFPPSYFKALPKHSSAKEAPPHASASSAAPKPQGSDPSNAPPTVPNPAHHSLHGLSAPSRDLVSSFAHLMIQGEPPPTDLSAAPPCPISAVPEEILVEILEHLAIKDMSSFIRLAQVCKRLAYLVITEDRVWKRLALGNEHGFAAMHYTWSCRVDGKPLGDDGMGGLTLRTADLDLSDPEDSSPSTPATRLSPTALIPLLVPSKYPTFRTLFQQRPRVRFNGCYISTVNYTRPGQSSPTQVTWNSPVHIVTYFRYLRFLRDGTCISLLTTAEPADVVPYLAVEHMHKNHGNLPTAPMKDALLGRWRLTGPYKPNANTIAADEGIDAEEADQEEEEGTVLIETAGVTPKYMYKMALSIGSAGRAAKNNKLAWQGYWSYNRLTDDWGEFGLKNDRAFYWSRVKSYGMSWEERGMKVR